MIAITTSSSTSVKPRRELRLDVHDSAPSQFNVTKSKLSAHDRRDRWNQPAQGHMSKT